MSKFRNYGSGKFGRYGSGVQVSKLPNDSGRIGEISTTYGDFRGGFNSAQLRDGTPPNASVNAVDIDLSKRGRLIRLAGNTIVENLAKIPTKMVLHPSLDGWANLVFFAGDYLGIRGLGTTKWTSVLDSTNATPVTTAIYGEKLIFYNGVGSPFIMLVGQKPMAAPTIPQANAYATFANRLYAGGCVIDGKYQPMSMAWSDVSGDPTNFIDLGSGQELLIDNPVSGDHVVALKTMGLNLMAILCRHSIWNAAFSGILERPADFSPRIIGSGCVDMDTVQATPLGVMYLSDDGVHLFDGNTCPNISQQINGEIVPLGIGPYDSSFDIRRNRYSLHTPTESWTYDLTEGRWLKSTLKALSGVLFGTQLGGVTWADITGDWSQYASIRWKDLERHEADDAEMYYINNTAKLAKTDPTSSKFFNVALTPLWDTPQTRGFSLTNLNETKAVLIEYTGSGNIHVSLPDFNAVYHRIYTNAVLPVSNIPTIGWLPVVHTGLTTGVRLEIVKSAGLEIIQMQLLTQTVSPKLPDAIFEEPELPDLGPSDAMFAPSIVFMDSFSAGKAQSIGHPLGSGGIRQFGRYDDVFGGPTYIETGGRDGGGYLKGGVGGSRIFLQTASGAPTTGGRYYFGTNESPPTQCGLITIHNLLGVPILGPQNLQNFGTRVLIQVMPDLSLRATNGGGDVILNLPTTYRVPADGWFAIETHLGTNPPLLITGGYVKTNLYTLGGPVLGDPIIRAVGINTGGSPVTVYMAYMPPNSGLCGYAILGPYGIERRWMYDLIFKVAWASAPGDSAESIRSYEYYETIGTELDGITPVNVGAPGGMRWGDIERWKNVSRIDHSAYTGEESLFTFTSIGELSHLTSRWLSGPAYPDTLDPVTRNTFVGTAKDFYRVSLDSATVDDIAEIEAIGPFTLAGGRSWQFSWGITSIDRTNFSATGPHPYAVAGPGANFTWPMGYRYGSWNAAFEQLLKLPSGTIQLVRQCTGFAGCNIVNNSGEWRAELGYTRGPNSVLERDPETGNRWDKDNLPQVGVRGTFQFLDALVPAVNPADRWVQFDIAQAAIEVAYRREIPNVSPPEPQNPVVDYKVVSFTSLTGVLQIYDISADFNGNTSTLTSGITSRVMDWGDGTGENIPVGVMAGVVVGQVTHTYDADGSTYIATLTVTNSFGLSNFISHSFVTTIPVLVANFLILIASGDPTGLTLEFTDLSELPGGIITSWHWNFGDGFTSTERSPVHIYAAEGPYTITLIVTGNHGQTDTTSQNVNLISIISGGDCGFDSDAVHNEPFVMGDDFAGGNPPLPAYINTEAFDTYYDGINFREAYDTAFDSVSNGISHSLDFDKTYDGHPSLKMVFGSSPAPVGHSFYVGAGWNTVPTDDGVPTETYYPSPQFGPLDLWHRIRWAAETGVMSQAGLTATSYFQGLAIVQIYNSEFFIGIFNRAGHIYLDMETHETSSGPNVDVAYDLGLETTFVGRSDGKFGELVWRYRGDPNANTVRMQVWLGDTCKLGGTSPVVNIIKPAFRTSGTPTRLGVGNIEHFNWIFTPVGANKNLWVADWKPVPSSVNSDPFHIMSGVPTSASPAAGILVMAGFAPTVITTKKNFILTNFGNIIVNGFAPSVAGTGHNLITAGLGGLTINGFSPGITNSVNKTVFPNPATLTINGFAPSLVVPVNKFALAGFGALTINGLVPSLISGIKAYAASGGLIATGFVPTVVISVNRTALTVTGNAVVSGFAPTPVPSNNIRINTNTGNIITSGFAPTPTGGSGGSGSLSDPAYVLNLFPEIRDRILAEGKTPVVLLSWSLNSGTPEINNGCVTTEGYDGVTGLYATDVAEPVSPPGIFKQIMALTFTGDFHNIILVTLPAGVRDAYYGMTGKIKSPYYKASTNAQRLFEVMEGSTGKMSYSYYTPDAGTTTNLRLLPILSQELVTPAAYYFESTNVANLDEWHRYSVKFKSASNNNVTADGLLTVWKDGVVCADLNGIAIKTQGADHTLARFTWQWTDSGTPASKGAVTPWEYHTGHIIIVKAIAGSGTNISVGPAAGSILATGYAPSIVVGGSGSSLYPNQPAGYTQLSPLLSGDITPITDTSYTVGTEMGWLQKFTGAYKVTDSSSPVGSTNVLQVDFPPGMGGGGSPADVWTTQPSIGNNENWGGQSPPRNPKSLYMSFWIKVSPGYPANLVANKLLYPHVFYGQPPALVFMSASADYITTGVDTASLSPGAATQYTAALFPTVAFQVVEIDGAAYNGAAFQSFFSNPLTSARQIMRGVWHHYEALFTLETLGAANGSCKTWLDGTLIINYINRIRYQPSRLTEDHWWHQLVWAPVYGGGGSVPNDGIGGYHRVKNLYVSGN